MLDVGVDERGKRKQKWVSGFATKAEAERKLTETLASLDQGTYVEALAICATCPVLNECYEWALHNAVDGVAGGMTSEARTAWRKANNLAEPTVSLDEFLPAEVVAADRGTWLTRCDAILRAVARWTRGRRVGAADRGATRRHVPQRRPLPQPLPRQGARYGIGSPARPEAGRGQRVLTRPVAARGGRRTYGRRTSGTAGRSRDRSPIPARRCAAGHRARGRGG